MPLTPHQNFERSLRPAKLFIRLYSLLQDDDHPTADELVRQAREYLGVTETDALMLVRNAAFLGFIRPGADGIHLDLCDAERANLLRQSVVVCCSATEAFLAALLSENLSKVIDARGVEFLHPAEDWLLNDLASLLKSFKTKDVITHLIRPDADRATWIGGLVLTAVKDSYVKGKDGVRLIARLLGVSDIWRRFERANRDIDNPGRMFDDIAGRRKRIVHRGDIRQSADEPASIDFDEVDGWVRVTERVCLFLDECVRASLANLGMPPTPTFEE